MYRFANGSIIISHFYKFGAARTSIIDTNKVTIWDDRYDTEH